ncbi:hypothetical protein KSAC_21540 [Komagataeibacter saccharivorans]|nr:transposase [Komagataeibacter saccharivorans]QBL94357.1 hypothetical protein KSAC_21540 [Komagataeibacter saccharivorans]
MRYMIDYSISLKRMPNDLPSWSSVYWQFRRWMMAGGFDVVVA